MCPHCKKKLTLQTNKNKITCSECGLEVVMDNRYQLSGVEFKNIAEWHNWQKEILKQEIIKDPNFELKSKVVLKHLSKNGKRCTRVAGEGECKLTREGLLYVGTQDGANVEKFFSMEKIYRLLFGAGEDFEIYEEKELYYFEPEDLRSCVIWYMASGILKQL